MDLSHSSEQTLLADSVGRFLAREYSDTDRRRFLARPEGWSRDMWRSFAEMGLMAMAFEEENGGLGGDETSLGLISEAFGRNLVCEPYFETAVLVGRLVELLGSQEQKERFLAPLIEGRLSLCLADAEGPGDPLCPTSPGTLARRNGDGWILSGIKTIVFGAPNADWLAVTAAVGEGNEVGVFMVPADTPGLKLSPFRTTDERWAADVELNDVGLPSDARLGDDAREALAATSDRAIAILCADAVGAMEAVLSATTEYLQTRFQFGQPLARFQVLQHALARMAVQIAEARAVTLLALLEARSEPQSRGLAASSAKAKVAEAAQFVGRSAIQLHGGVGVTEDLAIGAFFRRLTAFAARLGSIADHRRRYGRMIAGNAYSQRTLLRERADAGQQDVRMNLALSENEQAFLGEVRQFLAEKLPEDIHSAAAARSAPMVDPELDRRWRRILHEKGWAAPAWPAEYGGTGWSLARRYIFERECRRAGAPHYFSLGGNLLAPVMMKFGTPEQKAQHLPNILTGDTYWCQGFSEPEAGSDLASLRTRAVRDGDHYLVNGSKIWTSHAQYADWMFALVRTADTTRRQEGISFLLIPMDLPGISLRPIRLISGEYELNQVFLENVRVPAVNLVGEENRGWNCAKYLLEHERGGSFAASELRAMLDRVVRLATGTQSGSVAPDSTVGRRLTELAVDVDALEMLELTAMSAVAAGNDPGALPSMQKLRQTEIRQAIDELAVELIGQDALRWTTAVATDFGDRPQLTERELVMPVYMNDRVYTIFGGTSEVQLGIIAKLAVGL